MIAAIDFDGVEGARFTGRDVGIEPGFVRVGTPGRVRIVAVPGGPFYPPEFVTVPSTD